MYEKGGGAEYWKGVEEELDRLKRDRKIQVISYLYHEKIKK